VCQERRHEYRRYATVQVGKFSRVAAVRDCSGICVDPSDAREMLRRSRSGPKIEAASRDIFWIWTLSAASIASMTHWYANGVSSSAFSSDITVS
jgi:hypothetical protein